MLPEIHAHSTHLTSNTDRLDEAEERLDDAELNIAAHTTSLSSQSTRITNTEAAINAHTTTLNNQGTTLQQHAGYINSQGISITGIQQGTTFLEKVQTNDVFANTLALKAYNDPRIEMTTISFRTYPEVTNTFDGTTDFYGPININKPANFTVGSLPKFYDNVLFNNNIHSYGTPSKIKYENASTNTTQINHSTFSYTIGAIIETTDLNLPATDNVDVEKKALPGDGKLPYGTWIWVCYVAYMQGTGTYVSPSMFKAYLTSSTNTAFNYQSPNPIQTNEFMTSTGTNYYQTLTCTLRSDGNLTPYVGYKFDVSTVGTANVDFRNTFTRIV